jgi:ADP-ribose pyrophosphatase YjhB (NUDIX family)
VNAAFAEGVAEGRALEGEGRPQGGSAIRPPANKLEFLEELRKIAQLGLNYTRDSYDRERFERLLELASFEYGELSGLPPEVIQERFRSELGQVTPKVGLDAAIFSPEGRLLLIRRSDDGHWCLPCGWSELNETPEDGMRREVWEETGLEVEVRELLSVDSRMPGECGQPHTMYVMVFHCVPVGGVLTTTPEALEVGYFDPSEITDWHRDHGERAERVCRIWRERLMVGNR